jgi:hypothetical protein
LRGVRQRDTLLAQVLGGPCPRVALVDLISIWNIASRTRTALIVLLDLTKNQQRSATAVGLHTKYSIQLCTNFNFYYFWDEITWAKISQTEPSISSTLIFFLNIFSIFFFNFFNFFHPQGQLYENTSTTVVFNTVCAWRM